MAVTIATLPVEQFLPEAGRDVRLQREPFRLGYAPHLDGLRGLAILLVMVYHANHSLFSGGFIGVDIFFVLSGFLITSLLVQEYDGAGTIRLKAFYLRRVLRLFPALLAMLIAFSTFSIAVWGFEGARSRLVDSLIALFYMANWARAFWIHPPYELGHTWSLSIEEQFYALWPPLLLLLLRKAPTRLAIALIALGLAIASWMVRFQMTLVSERPMRMFNGLDTRADAVMMGCLLGVIVASGLVPRRAGGKLSRVLYFGGIASLSALLGIALVAQWHAEIMFQWLYFGVAVMAAVLILDCVTNPASIVKVILSFKPLVWIGVISYGLYLWHYPIYTLMYEAGYEWQQVMTVGTLTAFAIAIASFFLLERPFLKLKRRWEVRPRA
ncbi:MAG TPA: acyltransferase [Terriglobia bacterium]|nr:acyltransferase [Terriglobia bacterium]